MWDDLALFSAVARNGSLTAAAAQTGNSIATLSRRMSALEADLSVRLILRRTTRLALTHAGEELYRRAARIVSDADEAWRAVRRMDDTPRGLLRVSVTGPYFLRLFIDYLCDFPEVRIEVQSTPRHVDLLAEGVDVAMRIGPVKDQDLIFGMIGNPSNLLRVQAWVDRVQNRTNAHCAIPSGHVTS